MAKPKWLEADTYALVELGLVACKEGDVKRAEKIFKELKERIPNLDEGLQGAVDALVADAEAIKRKYEDELVRITGDGDVTNDEPEQLVIETEESQKEKKSKKRAKKEKEAVEEPVKKEKKNKKKSKKSKETEFVNYEELGKKELRAILLDKFNIKASARAGKSELIKLIEEQAI